MNLPYETIQSLVRFCTRITDLSLVSCSLTRDSIRLISKLPRLMSCECFGNQHVESKGISEFRYTKTLTELGFDVGYIPEEKREWMWTELSHNYNIHQIRIRDPEVKTTIPRDEGKINHITHLFTVQRTNMLIDILDPYISRDINVHILSLYLHDDLYPIVIE